MAEIFHWGFGGTGTNVAASESNATLPTGETQSQQRHSGTYTTTPVVVQGLSNALSVASGYYHGCAVLSDGRVNCWGGNSDGQLGDGSTTNQPTPVAVQALTSARAVSVGVSLSCALLNDSTVSCWGSNPYGQLGNGTTTGSFFPVTVQGLP